MPNIERAYMVPGLPHLVFGNGSWSKLKNAYSEAGKRARESNPDVLVIYSAQWISVLGHSFQSDPNPQGLHVDENWYDMGDFPFNFKVDVQLSALAAQKAESKGLATKTINYKGFPIDTGSLVALKFFNPDNTIPVMIVSSNIYANAQDSMKLGQAVREAIDQSKKKAVVINCSGLSNRFFTEDIDPTQDKISSAQDDEWNKKILDLIASGNSQEALKQTSEYVQQAQPEMMFKGFHWLMGVLDKPETKAEVLAYGPIWGTGAAIVEYVTK